MFAFLDPILIEKLAKEIHNLFITKSTTPLREWSKLSDTQKNRRLETAKLLLMCVAAKIPEEDSACILHNNWLSRNERIATELQKRSYCFQSAYEKQRYLDVYNLAKSLCEEEVTYIS